MPKKKKAARKTAARKTTKKRSSAKKKTAKPRTVARVKISTKVLGRAPVEHEFVLTDGRRLNSLYELVDALETMNDGTFKSHVNDMKNDFSNWIRDVFDERKFAKELNAIQDRMKMQREIMKKIVHVAKKEGMLLR